MFGRTLPAALLTPVIFGALLGSCSGPVEIVPPPPRPVPVPAPTPTPSPPPAPRLTGEWRDWPLTPGSWVYRQDARGSIALYGRTGADADFTVRCDRDRQRLYLSRRGETPAQMTVRTSSTLRSFELLRAGTGYGAAELGVRDSLIDAIGYSRGKWVVQSPGVAPLVLPAHSEILRVAEDCR
ncbi:hypothetical protein [Sphingomonas sp. G-3-2-10]|uniref:hypothetical protein n=1 Tax=Sphingomonas sp. G-3-2-10 TaxID=2728838 RepID=UPI00146A8E0B|nr:hypothetical protein [Sphingomonas sp. G-3-2-10]NML07543.1 hypothetical protein [Sphingomonas sp. G-3-2-10]